MAQPSEQFQGDMSRNEVEIDLNKFNNVRRWFDDLKSRSAVRKGMDVGKDKRNFGNKQTKESLKMMFQQDSESIKKVTEEKKNK